MLFAKDIEGLPKTVEEVNRRAGWTATDYLPELVPDRRQKPEDAPEDDDRAPPDDDGNE